MFDCCIDTVCFMTSQKLVSTMICLCCLIYSGEYVNQLHAATVPSLLASLVTELAAAHVDSIQVCALHGL